jgi:predicted RNA methylase
MIKKADTMAEQELFRETVKANEKQGLIEFESGQGAMRINASDASIRYSEDMVQQPRNPSKIMEELKFSHEPPEALVKMRT